MHLLSRASSSKIINALAKGIDVNARDDLGKTAMQWAAEYGHDEVAKTLIAHGAQLDAKSKTGYTPLHLAVGRIYGTMVKTLLEHQADVNARDDGGWTPLHRVAASDEADMRGRTEQEHLDLVRLLLDHGADLHARNRSGFTPLHYATLNRHLAAMTLLLDRGADVNAQADSTPLIIAVRGGNKDAVELLLSRGADVNAKPPRRESALEVAQTLGGREGKREILATLKGHIEKWEKPVETGRYRDGGRTDGCSLRLCGDEPRSQLRPAT